MKTDRKPPLSIYRCKVTRGFKNKNKKIKFNILIAKTRIDSMLFFYIV